MLHHNQRQEAIFSNEEYKKIIDNAILKFDPKVFGPKDLALISRVLRDYPEKLIAMHQAQAIEIDKKVSEEKQHIEKKVLPENKLIEIQSDQYSIEILKRANIDPAGFGFAMQYLEKLGGDFKGLEPYFVEHPTFKERIDLVKSLPQNSKMQPSLTPEEWKALKSICSEKAPIKFSTSQ